MRNKGLRIGRFVTHGVRKQRTSDLSRSKAPRKGTGHAKEFVEGKGRLKQSKYRNRKVVIDGISFDSKKEGEVYVQLKMLEKAGAIKDLELQPKYTFPCPRGDRVLRYPSVPNVRAKRGFVLGRPITYRADFKFTEVESGDVRVIDVKGFDTPISRLKRGLVLGFHGIEVECV